MRGPELGFYTASLGAMKEYVEPTPRARRNFYLWALLVLLMFLGSENIERFLPPLSSDPLEAVEQQTTRLLVATILSIVIYVALSVLLVHLTRRAIQSGQWPPKEMGVPFRTKVTRIEKPARVWAILAILLTLYVVQVGMRIAIYVKVVSITVLAKES